MADQTPERCDYLAIVSEWWSPTAGGGVGTAYPVLNLTTGEPVSHPLTEFPNPGAVFLTRRGTLKTWDFVILRPRQKNNYQSQKERDCSYIPLRMPDPIDNLSDAGAVAVVLNQPGFDPQSTSRQIQNPLHSVTPYFFVRKPKAVFGPLFRDAIHLSATDDVESINWRPASDSGVIYEFTDDEFSGQFDLVWYEHP
ncbi:MAG: hypothetical protein J2P46_18400, partial [Zavarzinella sp.]|nr:hypothetical protein [Zavarzinella sp.]